jgi:DNA invertase Pin-like site-specific DNA recombinase
MHKKMRSILDSKEKIRWASYARVSSNKQELESQENEMSEYTDNYFGKKYVSKGHESDIVSTMKHWTTRDGVSKLLGMCRANQIDLVVFYSVHRMGRDPIENYEIAEAFKDAGVGAFYITEQLYYGVGMSDMDEVMFAMMSGLAKVERNRKSRRAKRGYKKWRSHNPDKIWGQQPKLRGKKLELMIAIYKELRPISRPWDKGRGKGSSTAPEGMTFKYSYREMEEILGVTKTTIQRMVKKLVNQGILEPRNVDMARWKKVTHLSKKAAESADDEKATFKEGGFVTYGGEVIDRETPIFDKDGEMHPVYASNEELGPFSKPTGIDLHTVSKDIAKELDKMEFYVGH